MGKKKNVLKTAHIAFGKDNIREGLHQIFEALIEREEEIVEKCTNHRCKSLKITIDVNGGEVMTITEEYKMIR